MRHIEEDFALLRKRIGSAGMDDATVALDHVEGYVEQCADFQRAAEAERDALKVKLADLRADARLALDECEVERDALKQSEDDWRRAAEQATERGMAAEAEVEDWREDYTTLTVLVNNLRRESDTFKEQVERLREENHRLMRSGRGLHDRLKHADELEVEVERLRAGNAALTDRHNRESHGTASHEAMAYDALKERVLYYEKMSGLNYSRFLGAEEERNALKAMHQENMQMLEESAAEVERLRNSNSRLRKAVNWMRGCFDHETWEYKRATAVLEEEK